MWMVRVSTRARPDLRHTSAVLAAQTGAALAELMARRGHSTPAAALRYQHAAQGRDAEIARPHGGRGLPSTPLAPTTIGVRLFWSDYAARGISSLA